MKKISRIFTIILSLCIVFVSISGNPVQIYAYEPNGKVVSQYLNENIVFENEAGSDMLSELESESKIQDAMDKDTDILFMADEVEADVTDIAEAESSEAESEKPETGVSETAESEAVETDTEESEASETDTSETDAGEPETSETDTSESDTEELEASEAETTETDTEEPEASEAETFESDIEESETVETEDNETDTEESETTETEIETEELETISRIEWLTALTTAFKMTVSKNNYPDNYYSDIDSSSEYYYQVMLATEFGLVDVEAGGKIRPEDPATREFVARTLNLCMGYSADSDEYTFNEADEVTYADDIQVAVEHSWFKLKNNNFLPEQAVTTVEMEALIEQANEAVAVTEVDTDYDSTWEFADGVIVLPEDINAEATGDDEITIYDCPVELEEGSIFAVVENDFPVVRKVKKLTTKDNVTVITIETVATEDAFKSLDVQGRINGKLSDIQTVANNVELTYLVGGTAENNYKDAQEYYSLDEIEEEDIDAVMLVQSYEIPDLVRETYELEEGITADITCTISNVWSDYNATLSSAYVDVGATVTFTCNVSLDVLDAIGVADSVKLAEAQIYVGVVRIGEIEATLDLSAKGDLLISFEEDVYTGVYFDSYNGCRLIMDFNKRSFSIQSTVEVSAGVKLTATIDLLFLKGSIYGEIGAASKVVSDTYTDGNFPLECTHFSAYMYAEAGCSVEINVIAYKEEWGKEISLYNESNSPVKVAYHYEDGKPVSKCSRQNADAESVKYNYYTPADSQYGYNGATSGTSADGSTYNIFKFRINNEGQAVITGYNGNASVVSIPETLNGYEVVEIDEYAFKNNTRIKIVEMPDTIKIIREEAFNGCSNLTSVHLSGRLILIEMEAFQNCTSLISINIPKSLVKSVPLGSWGAGVFEGCISLETVVFDEGVTVIPAYLFRYCSGLKYIVLPDTVQAIYKEAFYNCTNLERVILPEGLTYIGEEAFYNCTSLQEIIIPDTVTDLGAYVFAYCTSLENVKLPNCRVNITEGLFRGCGSLTSIELPETVTYIHEYAFYNTPLKSIVLPDNLEEIEDYAFAACPALANVTFGKNLETIGNYSFRNCDSLTTVTIPDSVSSIGNNCFESCNNLSEVNLGTGLTQINEYTFNLCTSLTSIIIPYRVKKIENNAFTNCTNLREVTIPRATYSIDSNSFSYLSKLTICGVEGTYAQQYATNNDINFVTNNVKATSIQLNSGLYKLKEGYSVTLFWEVKPNNFSEKVVWTSSDTSIATVDSNGTVKGISLGTVTITATAGDVSATREVAVIQPITSLYISNSSATLEPGYTYQLSTTIYPSNASIKTLNWTSSNEAVATVDANGLVKGVSQGTAVIKAETTDGSGKSVSCNVTVNKATLPPPQAVLKSVGTSDGVNVVKWTEVKEADGYVIMRKPRGGKWEEIATITNSSTVRYEDADTSADLRYFYTVKAYKNNTMNLKVYAAYDKTGLGVITSVGIVKLKTINSEYGKNTITWEPVAGVQGYVIKRKTANGKWINLAVLKGANRSSYVDSKALSAGEKYTYTIFAMGKKKANGSKNYGGFDKTGLSVTASVKTVALKSVKAYIGKNTVRWNKVNGADGYIVMRKEGNYSYWWSNIETINSGNTLIYNDKSITSGKTYTYTVKAYYIDDSDYKVYGSYNSTGKTVTAK